MAPLRVAMLLMLAGGQLRAQPAVPSPQSPAQPEPASGKPILQPPPLQWDTAMLASHPALRQTATNFANLTGGLAFGMSPSALNAKLAAPYPEMSWNSLSLANEYPGEARMLAVPIAAAGTLRMDATACTGSNSFVVFLFRANGLFRISYRLTADNTCTETNDAAQQIYARYVTLVPAVAYSVRYRTGRTQVVDITDPAADTLVPVRWHQGAN